MRLTKFLVVIMLLFFSYGCGNQRDTPSILPFATQIVPAKDLMLLDKSSKVACSFADHFADLPVLLQNSGLLSLEGKTFRLGPWTQNTRGLPATLNQIRIMEYPPTFLLPYRGETRRFVCTDALVLPSSDILILGGTPLKSEQKFLHPNYQSQNFATDDNEPVNSTWIFHPASRSVRIGPPMNSPRHQPTITKLNDTRFLITGGWNPDPSKAISAAEIYDAKKNEFIRLPNLQKPRYQHSVAQLNDGNIIIVGGLTTKSIADSAYSLTATVETLDMNKKRFVLAGQLHKARYDAIVIPFGEKQALIVAGYSDQDGSFDGPSEQIPEIELYSGSLTNSEGSAESANTSSP
ncbi:MAG TPA: hypothetical protein EYN91_15970 [Candidatus Melainabacteria bacterium]|nr:hypothetical protein [Candidatus Melainabacteria bacterium]HIN63744.1 hypothetical protein [Candidatus Obscuribacterales bacterium]